MESHGANSLVLAFPHDHGFETHLCCEGQRWCGKEGSFSFQPSDQKQSGKKNSLSGWVLLGVLSLLLPTLQGPTRHDLCLVSPPLSGLTPHAARVWGA